VDGGGMSRYTDAERRRAVKDFECGGIRAAEICRRRGMSSVSLALWRRRYSGNTHSVPAAVPSWLPVVIADADPPPVDVNVVYVMIAGWPAGSGRRKCSLLSNGTGRLEGLVSSGVDACTELHQTCSAQTASTAPGWRCVPANP